MGIHPLIEHARRVHDAFASEPQLQWLRNQLREAAAAIANAKQVGDEADQRREREEIESARRAREYFESKVPRAGNAFLLDRTIRPPDDVAAGDDPSDDKRVPDDRLTGHSLVAYCRDLREGEKVPRQLRRFVIAKSAGRAIRNLPGPPVEKNGKKVFPSTTIEAQQRPVQEHDSPARELRIMAWAPRELAESLIRCAAEQDPSFTEFHAPLPPQGIGREYKLTEACFALTAIHDGLMNKEPPIVPRQSKLFGLLGHRFAMAIAKCRHVESVAQWNESAVREIDLQLSRALEVVESDLSIASGRRSKAGRK